MRDLPLVWEWVISRLGIGRRAFAGGGTPWRFARLNEECDATLLHRLRRHLPPRAAGEKVLLVMNVPPGQPLSLLLADNHTLIGDALTHVFKTAGYHVERVYDGVAVCEKISADVGRFDTLIADHQQQRLSGLDLVEWLRRMKFDGRIIVYSAALTAAERKHYRSLRVELVVAAESESRRLLEIVKALHGEK